MADQNSPPIDMAIAILRATNDGNDLTQKELALVELGANGRLSDPGKAALFNLLTNSNRKGAAQ